MVWIPQNVGNIPLYSSHNGYDCIMEFLQIFQMHVYAAHHVLQYPKIWIWIQ